MKSTKFNNQGFAHLIVVVAFVVIFAIAGAGYVVATHADSSSSTSSVSSAASTKAASSSSSSKAFALVGCTFPGPHPTLTYKQNYKPSFMIYNSGNSTVSGTFKTRISLVDSVKLHGNLKSTKTIKISNLKPGEQRVLTFTNSYSVPLSAKAVNGISYGLFKPGASSTYTASFCSVHLPLP